MNHHALLDLIKNLAPGQQLTIYRRRDNTLTVQVYDILKDAARARRAPERHLPMQSKSLNPR